MSTPCAHPSPAGWAWRSVHWLRWIVTLHPFDDGKLTSSKWAAIAKCSPDTALRDITDLLERGVLRKSDARGRSTSYELRHVRDNL